jgi:hypothetical protein
MIGPYDRPARSAAGTTESADRAGARLSYFVYEVPRGAPERAAERALRARTDPVYAGSVRRRARLVMSGAKDDGSVTRLREWLGGAR